AGCWSAPMRLPASGATIPCRAPRRRNGRGRLAIAGAQAASRCFCRDRGLPPTIGAMVAQLSKDRRSMGRRSSLPLRPAIRHAELADLAIAHIDCDAFYATVEKRDRPELAEQPVIVGGGQRGVVLACCYVARLYGVRSAMPMFKALAACPDAVVIRPDMAKYREVGRAVRAEMRRLTPLVEPLSIDEAFLDLSGTASLH